MKVIDGAIDRINRFQQSHRTTAVIVAVQKAYGDHRGGMLTAAITFYGFVAVFPLLLLFFTVVALVLSGHPALQERLINAALSEFPDLGRSEEQRRVGKECLRRCRSRWSPYH